jgi:hypothetical protein
MFQKITYVISKHFQQKKPTSHSFSIFFYFSYFLETKNKKKYFRSSKNSKLLGECSMHFSKHPCKKSHPNSMSNSKKGHYDSSRKVMFPPARTKSAK